jgi:L-threonylcarbamoyladenylate synthase
MPTLLVDPRAPDASAIARAAALLREGRLVAFPTETVYGIGAHALDARAVRRIYEAKGRPSSNPLIVHVADEHGARALAAEWPDLAARCARAFWPGPLTVVVRKRDIVPDEVTAGLDSVAVRVPAHPVALALLRAAKIPVAAPSANRSSELSPTAARHVERALGNVVDLIIDGGPTTVGIESTVVDVRGTAPVILRPGILGPDELEPVVGPVSFASAAAGSTEAKRSPGMLDRHYAPRARLMLIDASDARAIEARLTELRHRGEHPGAVVLHNAARHQPPIVAMPLDPAEYARRLYDVLHTLDDAGCTVILVERVPSDTAWAGIRDRLQRAAS